MLFPIAFQVLKFLNEFKIIIKEKDCCPKTAAFIKFFRFYNKNRIRFD